MANNPFQAPQGNPTSPFNVHSRMIVQGLQNLANGAQPGPVRLYDHQVAATLKVSTFFQTQSNPRIALVVLPTGAGKTGVAVLSAYACNANRVLVITPSRTISEQIQVSFCGRTRDGRPSFLQERGVCQNNNPRILPFSHVAVDTRDHGEWMQTAELVISNVQKLAGGRTNIDLSAVPNTFGLVIVDEAHHYPAPTWTQVVNHFAASNVLFLTATPNRNGVPILPGANVAYNMSHRDAVQNGIIRELVADELTEDGITATETAAARMTAERVRMHLASHFEEGDFYPQAMVLAQSIDNLNSAREFREIYNEGLADDSRERCEMFVGDTADDVLTRFKSQQFQTLVVVKRLLEGFDHKNISVVAIHRNLRSRVMFSQFVGRAVRKYSPTDTVQAVLVWHTKFQQRQNFDEFDTLAEQLDDNPDEA